MDQEDLTKREAEDLENLREEEAPEKATPVDNFITEETAEMLLKAGRLYRYKDAPRVIMLELPADFALLQTGGNVKYGPKGHFLARLGNGQIDILPPEDVAARFVKARRR